ncbi:hypothetical protein MMC10_001676 [Thelotrema lepadinum]|nr:hypothetical protein [Thelotrema lepadinum]
MSKAISPSEVSAHSTDVWIIVDGNVYDMSGFLDEHPGGSKILKRMGGKDASKQFWKVWHDGFRFEDALFRAVGSLQPETSKSKSSTLFTQSTGLQLCCVHGRKLIVTVPQRSSFEKILGSSQNRTSRRKGEVVTAHNMCTRAHDSTPQPGYYQSIHSHHGYH